MKSASEQNPSSQRQTNQISANAGVQRGPRVPSVRISHFFLVNMCLFAVDSVVILSIIICVILSLSAYSDCKYV